MKRFILKVIIFLLAGLCVDYLVGFFSTALQERSKGGTTQKDNYILNYASEDIIVMGSSRAYHHYIPNLMKDSLNKSVYNAGMDGKGIILNYGLLLEIIRRHKPNLIIYELTPDFDWIIGDNEKYLPHLRLAYDVRGIDSIFWDVDYTERVKMLSKSYRSNSLIPHLIYDKFISKPDSLKGYLPLFGLYNKKINHVRNQGISYKLDSLKIKYLNSFIKTCNDNNIELIFSISPDLYNSKVYYDYGRELAKKNNLILLDSYSSTLFNDPTLYQDPTHLNDKGATRYTMWVIECLKAKLNYK